MSLEWSGFHVGLPARKAMNGSRGLRSHGHILQCLTERSRISELPKWVSCVSQARVLWGRWRLLCFLLFDALSGDP